MVSDGTLGAGLLQYVGSAVAAGTAFRNITAQYNSASFEVVLVLQCLTIDTLLALVSIELNPYAQRFASFAAINLAQSLFHLFLRSAIETLQNATFTR